jgi:hypothetical protein
VIVTALAGATYLALTADPDVADQLEDVRRDAAARGYRAEIRLLDLRGTGVDTYLVLLRNNAIDSILSRRGPGEVSDEVRLYEVDDGVSRGAIRVPSEDCANGNPYVFRVDARKTSIVIPSPKSAGLMHESA